MHPSTKRSLLAVALLASSLATAENSGDAVGFYVNAGAGQYNFDSKREAENDLLYQMGVGYRFDNPWAVELLYLETDTDEKGENVDYKQWRLDGLYNFYRNNNLQPYLAFGAGLGNFDWQDYSTHDETVINAGGGLKYYLGDSFSVNADARAINSVDEGDVDMTFTLGVAYYFGSPKATPAAAAAPAAAAEPVDNDLDKDGVPNRIDQCPDTSAGAKVDAKGCYLVLKEKVVIDLNVEFKFDSTEHYPLSQEKINEVVTFLKQYPQTAVTLEGHTDSMGSTEYNQKLSLRRAQKVADVLSSDYGIDASRINVAGYGEERPIADNTTDDGRQRNRRVYAVFESMAATTQQ